MTEITYHVPEMHCEACQNSIRQSIGKLDGIGDVSFDMDHKRVRVSFDEGKADVLAIKDRIERAGFEVG